MKKNKLYRKFEGLEPIGENLFSADLSEYSLSRFPSWSLEAIDEYLSGVKSIHLLDAVEMFNRKAYPMLDTCIRKGMVDLKEFCHSIDSGFFFSMHIAYFSNDSLDAFFNADSELKDISIYKLIEIGISRLLFRKDEFYYNRALVILDGLGSVEVIGNKERPNLHGILALGMNHPEKARRLVSRLIGIMKAEHGCVFLIEVLSKCLGLESHNAFFGIRTKKPSKANEFYIGQMLSFDDKLYYNSGGLQLYHVDDGRLVQTAFNMDVVRNNFFKI